MAVLAGIDFFSVEVLTWRGLATYYVLFHLHLKTWRVTLAGVTMHPTEQSAGRPTQTRFRDTLGRRDAANLDRGDTNLVQALVHLVDL